LNPSQSTDLWTRRRVLSVATGLTAASLAAPAFAGSFPDHPIRLVVGNPPGGINDQIMRAAAVDAGKKLGQPVIVFNKPGAAGVVSFLTVRNAPPDGYTIGVVGPPLWRQPVLEDVDYDPIKDFTFIVNIAETIFGLVVRTESPFKTWADVVAYGRANPGKISFGAPPGPNQTSHILAEGIARKDNLQWVPVGYKGSAESIPALLGGYIAFSVEPIVSVSSLVRAGKARILAVASPNKLKSWPDVPTFKDLGYTVNVDSPTGLAGPAHMAPDTVRALHDAFKFALEQPTLLGVLDQSDQVPRYMGTQDFTNYVIRAAKEQRELLINYGMAKKA
jgi:tripartite-type tricarboxylate transporter receptor subunit TctC